jgi:glucokinase
MFIGVDIGGSNMAAGLFDNNKKLLETAKVKSKAKEAPEIIVEQLYKVIDKLKTNIPVSQKLKGIGIGIAGLIDRKTSIVKKSVNINLTGINLIQVLKKRYDVSVAIDNDVNVGVLGEAKYGVGVGCDDVVGAFVGTGIGGGLILNGKLYAGSGGLAAELGHTIIKKGGAYCPGCGSQGCLEAYAAKVGIEKKIQNLAKKKIKSVLIDLVIENNGKLKSSHIKKAIQANDLVALDIIEEAMEYLGAGLGSMMNMINPSMIILGGGVIEAIGEKYLPQIKRAAMRNCFADIYAQCDFKIAQLGDLAGIYGAMELIAD